MVYQLYTTAQVFDVAHAKWCVCVCVCMYIYTHVCIYVYTYMECRMAGAHASIIPADSRPMASAAVNACDSALMAFSCSFDAMARETCVCERERERE